MNIFVIANGYPTEREPQFGCFEKDQALELQKHGHRITILYVDGRFRKYWRKVGISYKVDNAINIYGIFLFPIIFLEIFSYKISHLVRSMLLIRLFRYVLNRQDKPDIIYAHYCYNIANAVKISKKYSIPLVGIEHWSAMNQECLSRKARYLGTIAYYNSDRLLAVSNKLASSIKRHFNIQPIVVNDMIGEEFINQPIYDDFLSKKKYRFISVGSLLPIKRYDLLIRSFSLVSNLLEYSELLIIGDGPEYSDLNRLIVKLSLSDRVKLLGRKNKQEIIDNLLGSDCFCVSSQSETFGVACAEALTLGLPVISTPCGGPEEFITIDNGIVIKDYEPQSFANAMIEMYRSYKKYNRKIIAEECRLKFSPKVIASQLTNIFDTTIKG